MSSKFYTPTPLVSPDPKFDVFVSAVNREFSKISSAYNDREMYITDRVYYKAVERPSVFQIVFADGVHWNPGEGAGFYIYTPTLNPDGTVQSMSWRKS